MSICIISDHIIMLRQNFIIILIDEIKPKYEGGSFSPQIPPSPPGSAPGSAPGYTHPNI